MDYIKVIRKGFLSGNIVKVVLFLLYVVIVFSINVVYM